MSLSPGTRFGPYEVVASLGAGGMGEVYRARDTKLDRDVALKILPEPFATDPDRLMRFTREAKTLAALNHPGIAQVYAVEDRAIVMELVDGRDLSAVIAQGAMPLDEAITASNESGTFEVYVTSFPVPGRHIRVSTAGGSDAHWRDDGAELFFQSQGSRRSLGAGSRRTTIPGGCADRAGDGITHDRGGQLGRTARGQVVRTRR